MRLLWRNAGSVASYDHKLTTDFSPLISLVTLVTGFLTSGIE
jgi:hypothetical protein